MPIAPPQAVQQVAPSDHVVADVEAFHTASPGECGQLVTFGITPIHPETAYGYLELAEMGDAAGDPVRLKQFVEKPDLSWATEMLAAGSFKWNAGKGL